jgi:hypothetical protein
VLITNKPALAGGQPLAGSGAGAFACGNTPSGAHVGNQFAGALSRPRSAAASAAQAVPGQHQAGFRAQSEQYMTLIAPAGPGEVGPHPVREPEPV